MGGAGAPSCNQTSGRSGPRWCRNSWVAWKRWVSGVFNTNCPPDPLAIKHGNGKSPIFRCFSPWNDKHGDGRMVHVWLPFRVHQVTGMSLSSLNGPRFQLFSGYPLVKRLHSHGKSRFFMSRSDQLFLWPFSIAMLNYQRVANNHIDRKSAHLNTRPKARDQSEHDR